MSINIKDKWLRIPIFVRGSHKCLYFAKIIYDHLPTQLGDYNEHEFNKTINLIIQNEHGKFYKQITNLPTDIIGLVLQIRLDQDLCYVINHDDNPLIQILLDMLIDHGLMTEEELLPWRTTGE